MKPVLRSIQPQPESPDVSFFCPGCKCHHGVWTDKANVLTGARWSWNADYVRPTFRPSLLVRCTEGLTDEELDAWNTHRIKWRPRRELVCHSFVTDGRIQFLGDCTHELAGQTVDLPPIE